MRVFPVITNDIQKAFEAACGGSTPDALPMICGICGRACRQMNKDEGANRMNCMRCPLAVYARDKQFEALWDELEDVLVYEDENGCMCLENDWHGWPRGTDREELWYWFDENHSKGVGWLMNEYEGPGGENDG